MNAVLRHYVHEQKNGRVDDGKPPLRQLPANLWQRNITKNYVFVI